MSQFDEALERLREEGIDEETLKMLEASPIRAEASAAKATADAATARAQKAEAAALKANFDALGIKVSPDAVKLPDDLDITDAAAVKVWATGANLIEAVPEPPEVTNALAGQARIDAATAGGQTVVGNQPAEKFVQMHKAITTCGPGALELLRAEAMATIEAAGLTFGNVEHSSDFAPLASIS